MNGCVDGNKPGSEDWLGFIWFSVGCVCCIGWGGSGGGDREAGTTWSSGRPAISSSLDSQLEQYSDNHPRSNNYYRGNNVCIMYNVYTIY